MIALAIALISTLAMTPATARQEARDSASEITGHRITETGVGRCVIHGRFARCPVRARNASWRCRYVAHIRQRGRTFDITATQLECWRR